MISSQKPCLVLALVVTQFFCYFLSCIHRLGVGGHSACLEWKISRLYFSFEGNFHFYHQLEYIKVVALHDSFELF